MCGLTHREIETNGIRMHVAEQGVGPLVVLCHGFPESWYSWRHQLAALAAAGYHAVAPDMRGYGRTDRPEEIDRYTQLHHVGDMVGLLDALGEETAVIAGHDWGAPVAWHAVLLRPDRFRAAMVLSVPFSPRGTAAPTKLLRQAAGDGFMYMLYFQSPGVAEAELERDPRVTVRNMLYGASGEGAAAIRAAAASSGSAPSIGMVPRGGGMLRGPGAPAMLPAWINEADIDFYAGEFKRSGFRGGLNYYRNVDRNWELMAPFAGAAVTVPALYMAGDRDMVLAAPGTEQLLANMKHDVPALRSVKMLSGRGHWTQQERPAEVNAAIIDFLCSLPD